MKVSRVCNGDAFGLKIVQSAMLMRLRCHEDVVDLRQQRHPGHLPQITSKRALAILEW